MGSCRMCRVGHAFLPIQVDDLESYKKHDKQFNFIVRVSNWVYYFSSIEFSIYFNLNNQTN